MEKTIKADTPFEQFDFKEELGDPDEMLDSWDKTQTKKTDQYSDYMEIKKEYSLEADDDDDDHKNQGIKKAEIQPETIFLPPSIYLPHVKDEVQTHEEGKVFAVTLQTDTEAKSTCHICKKKFKNHIVLKTHSRIHTGERPYACQTCNRTFVQPSHLAKHRMYVHKEIVSKCHKCEDCGEIFYAPCNLEVHVRRKHTKERPFICECCGARFVALFNLKTHERIHKDRIAMCDRLPLPATCEVCNKTFVRKQTFDAHNARCHPDKLSTDSEPDKFNCETCGKGFKRKINLEKHTCIKAKKPKVPCHR